MATPTGYAALAGIAETTLTHIRTGAPLPVDLTEQAYSLIQAICELLMGGSPQINAINTYAAAASDLVQLRNAPIQSLSYSGSGVAVPGFAILPFDVVGVGPSNPLTAPVARFPLALPFVPLLVSAVAATVTSGTTINVAYGSVAMTTATLPGATATDGNCFFDPVAGTSLGAAEATTVVAPLYAGAVYPSGDELTLRISTPSGGGVGGLKVLLWGSLL
jgi:hypothetical protein